MPALREPGLGPIVGHVTDTSCRVWIRGDETGDEGAALDSERRTLGVATILEVPKADRAKLRTDEGLREVRDSLVGQVKAELQKATDGKAHTLPPLYYFSLHREYDRTGPFCFGEDRKSVWWGTSVPVRLDLGGAG